VGVDVSLASLVRRVGPARYRARATPDRVRHGAPFAICFVRGTRGFYTEPGDTIRPIDAPGRAGEAVAWTSCTTNAAWPPSTICPAARRRG
jgi:hypothetical protein